MQEILGKIDIIYRRSGKEIFVITWLIGRHGYLIKQAGKIEYLFTCADYLIKHAGKDILFIK